MNYIDPGLFGTISQVGITVFLLLVTAFTFFMKPIKTLWRRLFHRDVLGKSGALKEMDENTK